MHGTRVFEASAKLGRLYEVHHIQRHANGQWGPFLEGCCFLFRQRNYDFRPADTQLVQPSQANRCSSPATQPATRSKILATVSLELSIQPQDVYNR